METQEVNTVTPEPSNGSAKKAMKIVRRKFYFFRGMPLYMRELTFEEDVELKRILQNYLGRIVPDGIDSVVSSMMESGALEDAIALVLKPIPGLGWFVRLRLYMLGLERKGIIRKMRNSEIAGVVTDFFLINISSISAFLSFENGSDWTTALIPLLGKSFYLKNPFYTSAAAIPPERAS